MNKIDLSNLTKFIDKLGDKILTFINNCRKSLRYNMKEHIRYSIKNHKANLQDNLDNSTAKLDNSHTGEITAVWFPYIPEHSVFWEGLQESIINWDKNDKKPEIQYDNLDESHTSWVTAVGSPFIPGHDQFGENTRKRIANDNANKTE